MASPAHRKFFFAALAASLPIAQAAPARAFDTDRIHGYYRDGDFEKVIRELDAFQKSGRKCPRADSLFLEKHLAVVYAANPATRELGRYHMHKLLDLSPTADLLDMFVGEEVDGVFDKVRKEHVLSKALEGSIRNTAVTQAPAPALAASATAARNPVPARPVIVAARAAPIASPAAKAARPETSVSDTAGETSWKDKRVWICGGAALALVAFTLYYAGSPKEPAPKTYVVPATASR